MCAKMNYASKLAEFIILHCTCARILHRKHVFGRPFYKISNDLWISFYWTSFPPPGTQQILLTINVYNISTQHIFVASWVPGGKMFHNKLKWSWEPAFWVKFRLFRRIWVYFTYIGCSQFIFNHVLWENRNFSTHEEKIDS